MQLQIQLVYSVSVDYNLVPFQFWWKNICQKVKKSQNNLREIDDELLSFSYKNTTY